MWKNLRNSIPTKNPQKVQAHLKSTGPCVHGWRKKRIIHAGGGLPTLPGLNLSTFQPSERGFFRVHTSMWREREPGPKFSNFSGPLASIPQNWQIGFGNPLSSCYNRTTTYAGGTDSLKNFALLKSLKIRSLENYVCLLRHTFTDF
jgi:hypothetical protein